jgi:hypothetical protein
MHKVYQRKCVQCKDKFTPQNNNQICCSGFCAYEYVKKQTAKNWQKEKKELKEKLMSKSDYLNILQKVFNTFIRMRDKDKNCISCDRKLIGKFDAGHFFSVGSYPSVRFDLTNIHGQCVHCNQFLHGNVHEYRKNITKRITEQELDELILKCQTPANFMKHEVIEMIEEIKKKIKELRLK